MGQAAEPASGPESAEHIHDFPETWSFDDEMHWHECSCGEKIEQGAHEMEWTTVKRASAKEPGRESGVCSVCGYTTERELAYTGLNPWLRVTVIGVGGLVALTILVLAVDSARRRSKGRSARAEKPAAYSGRHVKK